MPAARSANKFSRVFLRFQYGAPDDPEYQRLVNDNTTASLAGALYAPAVVADIKMPEQTIGLREQEIEIALPLVAGGFVERISDGHLFSPIAVKVMEQLRADNGSYLDDVKTLYVGRVTRTKRYASGRDRLVSIFASTAKSRLDFPLGISCNHHCVFAFGGNGCFYPILNVRKTVTASGINQTKIVLTGSGVIGPAAGYWIDGWVSTHGINIKVKDWVVGTNDFRLYDVATPEFDGNVNVLLYPGCDHRWTTCKTKWSNEQYFGGYGVAIPDYNPLFEVKV